MATFAPPVRRGDFLYSSVLYADAGNGNHHPRATVAELASLLRPETRSKDIQPTKTKDPVGHWYTAQLIHYGLPTTKDKNAAKVRLLNALNSFKLEVPAWISKVESDLKKEWETENRKLKKSGKSDKDTKGATRPSRKTTTHQDMNITVNVSLLSGDTSTAEQLGIKAISNTAKLSPKGAVGKRKRDGTPDLKTKRTPTKSTATPKSRPLGTQSRKSAQESPLKRVRVKKEAKTEASHFLSPQNSHKYLKQEPDPYSLAQSTPYIKEEPQHRNHDPGCIILSGLYRITCPAATSHFQSLNSSSMYLTLFRDADRGVWWASFTWSAWDMLIQMNPGPDYDTLGEGTSLGWRMRDLETGELKFGRGCTGEITFYRDQTLLGYLFEVPRVGTVEFWGQRIAGVDGVDGDEYQADWESFVKEAYGR